MSASRTIDVWSCVAVPGAVTDWGPIIKGFLNVS